MATMAEALGGFAASAKFEDLSARAVSRLKVHVLDALGCAVGAIGAEPVELVRRQVGEFGGAPFAGLIGGGRRGPRRSAPDRAALYNGALVRYLDFNDAYLPRGRHVTRATTWRRFWRPPSTPTHRAGTC